MHTLIFCRPYGGSFVVPTAPYLALGEKQTFQVFTGAAPGGSSASDLHGWRKCRGLPGAVSAAIHGSRLTWKV